VIARPAGAALAKLSAPASLAGRVALVLVSLASVAHADADTAKIARGARVYGDYCASCHGDELRNTSGGVTFDLRRLRAEDHSRFQTVVLNGKSPMPPWRGVLSPEQIDAVWAYIRAIIDRR
jgi:mono/diheme cytochrome c family protein